MKKPTLAGFVQRLLVCACLSMGAGSSHAASDLIRIMVAGIEKQIYLPAALAERLGYFKEQGLNVDCSAIRPASTPRMSC